ncbi:MAG: hypothetical protein APR63_09680 [Desulfuromonas sp. SDB]|nr:MAG: hypothetical protein APR63_09680 [Desulfuromonas sp. SDB]
MKKFTWGLALFVITVNLSAHHPDFSGVWQTTYGTLTLVQNGNEVKGWYNLSGISTIQGTIDDQGKLNFTYQEPFASGEGWFELSDDQMTFQGQWHEQNSIQWYSWEGIRSEQRSDLKWLVILESEWQQSLSESEYSFGEMLDAFLSRIASLNIRHRFIHNDQDLFKYCLEASSLPGEIYLIIATHGDKDGLIAGDGLINAQQIVRAIEPIGNLHLIHFSSCNIMGGSIPDEILNSRSEWPGEFIVSGYTKDIDWGGSAVIEFFYLDMIFDKNLTPQQAAQAVLDDIRFAGTNSTEWMDNCGFKYFKPH